MVNGMFPLKNKKKSLHSRQGLLPGINQNQERKVVETTMTRPTSNPENQKLRQKETSKAPNHGEITSQSHMNLTPRLSTDLLGIIVLIIRHGEGILQTSV